MWSTYPALLGHRGFVWLALGQVTSQFGNYVGYVAVMALIYRLTGSTLLVGTYTGAQALAGLVVGPLAGYAADRVDQRRFMIASDLARAVLVATLIMADSAWQILTIAILKSVAAAFFNPAKVALTPRILSESHLSAGLSLEQTLMGAAQIAAPAVGGIAVPASEPDTGRPSRSARILRVSADGRHLPLSTWLTNARVMPRPANCAWDKPNLKRKDLILLPITYLTPSRSGLQSKLCHTHRPQAIFPLTSSAFWQIGPESDRWDRRAPLPPPKAKAPGPTPKRRAGGRIPG